MRWTTQIRGHEFPLWVVAAAVLIVGTSFGALVSGPIPTRLGFHMYAGTGGPVFTAIDAEGQEISDVEGILPRIRQDLPYVDHLPEYVCAELPHVAQVTVAQQGRERTLQCP